MTGIPKSVSKKPILDSRHKFMVAVHDAIDAHAERLHAEGINTDYTEIIGMLEWAKMSVYTDIRNNPVWSTTKE